MILRWIGVSISCFWLPLKVCKLVKKFGERNWGRGDQKWGFGVKNWGFPERKTQEQGVLVMV